MAQVQPIEAQSVQFDEKTLKFLDQQKKPSTKRTYAFGLSEFQLFLKESRNMTISEWITEVDADSRRTIDDATDIASDSLTAFGERLQKKGLSSCTINNYVSAIQSLFYRRVNGRYKLTTKFAQLPRAEVVSSKEEWTLELLSDFFLSMDKQIYRALVAVIFQSGLSLEDILKLTYGDIAEEFEAGTVPLALELKRRKTGVHFYTFLGKVAVEQLKILFSEIGTPRIDQPIFHREKNPDDPNADMKPITKAAIERFFSRRAKRFIKKEWVGSNPRRPHSIRAAFQKLLVLAGCPEVITESLMGHSVEKNQMAYIIEGMSKEQFREVYKKFEFALTFRTEPIKANPEVKSN